MPHIDIDGLSLNVDRYGVGPVVVMLHGFTGTRTTWDSLIRTLERDYTTLSVDLVGHGLSGSPAEVDRYRMERAVDDLVALLHAIGFQRAVWLGYSLGGRVALQVAVRHPEAVSALVLEGATPGLPTAEERAARIAADEQQAQMLETRGLEAFVDYWESIPLWDSQRETLTDHQREVLRRQRLAQRATGLANSLRGMGTGAQAYVAGALPGLRVPVLLTAGRLDTKFTQIAHEMAAALPEATVHIIEGAGHCAHLECPDEFNTVVADFLRTHRGRL